MLFMGQAKKIYTREFHKIYGHTCFTGQTAGSDNAITAASEMSHHLLHIPGVLDFLYDFIHI